MSANQTIINNQITVHGRGSLVLSYRLEREISETETVQVDLSGRTLFFEADGVPIREALVNDPNDPKGKLLILENDQIVTLKTKGTRCIIRDETDITSRIPIVLWSGTIARDGYVGDPDAVDDE